jgi:pimeloyl-ACP methyl ester carboxylesterase
VRTGGRTHEATLHYTETWCKGGEIDYVVLSGGVRVRYLRAGSGPPLLLMHTVRTQLDHFQLVIPQITDGFTVYAVDFPGMGWSDIAPGASYEEPALRAAVVRVVEELDLSELTLAGESMGGTLALTASVELGDRVRRVPVTLVYGDHDWSRPSDRQANIDSVPGARYIELRDTGHFTALEAPNEVARILHNVATRKESASD